MIRLSGFKNTTVYIFNTLDPVISVYCEFDEDDKPVTAVATTTNVFHVVETPEQVIAILNNVTLPLTN